MKMPRKTILITGASAGIGAATALMAARGGYNVAIHYRSDAKAAQLVAHMAEDAGAVTHVFKADVGIPKDIERLFAEFDEKFGTLDALVNNAGMVDVAARLDIMTADRIRRMVDVNLVGAMLVAKEAVLRMSQNFGGDGSTPKVESLIALNGLAKPSRWDAPEPPRNARMRSCICCQTSQVM